ncbi:MAG: alpha/beta fold hydrolase [Caldilineaceae bacterium]
MARHLQTNGWQASVVSPQPSDGSVGIEVLAQSLAETIDSALSKEQPLALVGFSMGGLICRYYAQQLDQGRRTQQLITLSTPHQGTYAAYLFDRPAPLQMRPGSQFLQELNQDLSLLKKMHFTSMWTPFDLTILPAHSSRMPVGDMVQIRTLIHRFVVDDRRVWRAVAECLKSKERLEIGA